MPAFSSSASFTTSSHLLKSRFLPVCLHISRRHGCQFICHESFFCRSSTCTGLSQSSRPFPARPATLHTVGSAMASGSFQEHLLDATFPFEHDVDISLGDYATLLDITSQVWGDGTGMGCYPLSDISTPLQPMVTTNGDAHQGGDVAMLDVPLFQCAPRTDRAPTAIIQPHVVLPEVSHAILNDIHMQEIRDLRDSSNACDRTASRDHTRSSACPLHHQYATTEDWNRQRGLFTKLYLEENKTLNEVKSILKEQYGFNAT